MNARSGSRTPWQEWDGELGPQGVVLYREGKRRGDADLLAEAIRSEGIAQNLAEAYRFVDTSVVQTGFYGYVDGDNVATVCDETGLTADGERVETVIPCTFASIEVS